MDKVGFTENKDYLYYIVMIINFTQTNYCLPKPKQTVFMQT